MLDASQPSDPFDAAAGEPVGLSTAEAASRLKRDGPNELPSQRRRTTWHIAADLAREPMLQLLIGAGLIYLILGDLGEALVLMSFVLLTIGISLYQEGRTARVLEALRDLSSPRALVIRDGRRCRVAGRDLVVGDWLVLAEGDRVAADAVLHEAHDLQTDESLLTGESVPVRKLADAASRGADASRGPTRPGGDDLPVVFAGSLVVRGHGLAEVTATGARSQIGAIGQALKDIEQAPSALQRQTRQLVRLFAALGLALSAAVTLLHGWLRDDWLAALLSGITLAMSMLPQEFLLILTVFMAMGAWRLSKQRVLVRRGSAIEALGATTVLCTDKTGTLTLNRMTVAELRTEGHSWRAGSTEPLPEPFHTLLEFGVLASQRDPFDPMERAFWDLADEHLTQAERVHLHPDWRLAHEYALSPDLLAMSHVWQQPGRSQHIIAAKGAPEAIVDLCHLPDGERERVRAEAEAMAASGLRVLGVARAQRDGPPPGQTWPAGQHDHDFAYLGLVGLVDPLRPGVPEAVALCRAAGIRVAMITGDLPATALAIAALAGIDTEGGVLSGPQLQGLSDEALRRCARRTQVFARVMPEQKWRIVRALQAEGEVVAMTGDGVNDAPSLKAADIGVAMGARGTDVAREAAAIVLLDDDFGSITQAIRSGRRIGDNLRKATAFVLAVHVPIAGLTLWPLLMGWPLLFMPVHIAFLELVIDPVCSVVFEAEAAEPDIMKRPPRRPDSPLLGRAQVAWGLLQGGWVLATVAGYHAWLLQQGADARLARTGGFVALVLANVALILSMRTVTGPIWEAWSRTNPTLWRMLAATVAALALVLGWPTLRDLFQLAPLTLEMAWQVAGVGGFALVGLEALKALRRRTRFSACGPDRSGHPGRGSRCDDR